MPRADAESSVVFSNQLFEVLLYCSLYGLDLSFTFGQWVNIYEHLKDDHSQKFNVGVHHLVRSVYEHGQINTVLSPVVNARKSHAGA